MKYVIVDYPVSDEVITVVEQYTPGAERVNLAGNKCVLKYSWPKPAILINYTEYSYDDILVEMAKPEWTPGDLENE